MYINMYLYVYNKHISYIVRSISVYLLHLTKLQWLLVTPPHFSRKTFRRRVLQKIVGVSHTTHIPHISSTFYISHTYPFQTYPPHISHTYPAHCTYPTHIHSKRIPHIRIPSVRIHAMRIHSKGCNTYPTNHHQYPIHIQHIIHIPHISISNVSIPNVSHQYVSIPNVSTRIPPVRIHSMRIHSKSLHQQEWLWVWASLHIISYHSYHCYSAGMVMNIKTLLFLQFFAKLLIEYNFIARVWTWISLLAIGLSACLPVVCFCACFLIIFYYSIPPGGMGRVNRKATLSLKTRRRSPKTVAKRKFHFLAVNPLATNVVSIAQNCSETQI